MLKLSTLKIKLMNVKLIRMSSGEDLVTEVVDSTDSTITVKNAIVGVPSSQGTLTFVAWSPMLSKDVKEIEVQSKFVVYVSEPDQQIIDQYEQMYSPIATPEKKKLIL